MKDVLIKLCLEDTLIKEIAPEDDGYYYLGKMTLAKYKMVILINLIKSIL